MRCVRAAEWLQRCHPSSTYSPHHLFLFQVLKLVKSERSKLVALQVGVRVTTATASQAVCPQEASQPQLNNATKPYMAAGLQAMDCVHSYTRRLADLGECAQQRSSLYLLQTSFLAAVLGGIVLLD